MKTKAFLLFLGCSSLLEGALITAQAKQVTVGPEDTVYGIAYKEGIPTRTLISANNLKPPYTLREGQVLTIPGANEHIVGQNETLQSIAEDYGVKVDILAQENNITSPFFVKAGDRLSIPSRDTESFTEALKPPTQEISTTSLAPLPLVKSAPPPIKSTPSPVESEGDAGAYSSLEPLPETPPAPDVAATAAKETSLLPDDLAAELAQEKNASKESSKKETHSPAKPMLMGNLTQKNVGAPIASDEPRALEKKEEKKLKVEAKKPEKQEEKEVAIKDKPKKEASALFIWPVEGKIISPFSPGGKNDGINIKAEEGTPVKASAAGEVMYSGSELKGFGNLLLIKHKDGWMTAYAHNSELLVQKGDAVKQGQTIAKAGKTGDVKVPQVHFEIRKGKQPVDPLPKLKS